MRIINNNNNINDGIDLSRYESHRHSGVVIELFVLFLISLTLVNIIYYDNRSIELTIIFIGLILIYVFLMYLETVEYYIMDFNDGYIINIIEGNEYEELQKELEEFMKE